MYAVELYLEDKYADRIKSLWQRLANKDISTTMLENGCQPHITLGVFGDLDVDVSINLLDPFFDMVQVPGVDFAVLGCFPATKVLHCTPTVTNPLLAVHSQIHEVISPVVSNPVFYYQPGHWVPHCTIAIDLTVETLTQAFDDVLGDWQPFQSRFQAVALVNPSPKTVEFWVKEFGDKNY
jgi:2'-5' RNA ligase